MTATAAAVLIVVPLGAVAQLGSCISIRLSPSAVDAPCLCHSHCCRLWVRGCRPPLPSTLPALQAALLQVTAAAAAEHATLSAGVGRGNLLCRLSQ